MIVYLLCFGVNLNVAQKLSKHFLEIVSEVSAEELFIWGLTEVQFLSDEWVLVEVVAGAVRFLQDLVHPFYVEPLEASLGLCE